MWTDEIVEEIHQIREAYAETFDYDLDAIFADLRKKETESGREVVNLSRKTNKIARWSEVVKNTGDKEHISRC